MALSASNSIFSSIGVAPNLSFQQRILALPLYEYSCETCGQFEAWRAIAEVSQPMHCPDCEVVARRLFSPPALLSTGLGSARRASSEPRLVQKSASDREPVKPKTQTKTRGRPWMLDH